MKIIGVTGHRNLFHDSEDMKTKFKTLLNNLKADMVITGMAIGFDQLVAEACLETNIKYIAAVPFVGQEKMWPQFVQKRYHELLAKADKIQIVSEGGYAAWKMHVRNEWIVNNSDEIISYYNGLDEKGSGTAACVKFAIKKQKPITNFYSLMQS